MQIEPITRIFMKVHDYDTRGIELECIRTGLRGKYFAKLDGSCSKIQYISDEELMKISSGEHPCIFSTRLELMIKGRETIERKLAYLFEDIEEEEECQRLKY